jgi:hypothetical protein
VYAIEDPVPYATAPATATLFPVPPLVTARIPLRLFKLIAEVFTPIVMSVDPFVFESVTPDPATNDRVAQESVPRRTANPTPFRFEIAVRSPSDT